MRLGPRASAKPSAICQAGPAPFLYAGFSFDSYEPPPPPCQALCSGSRSVQFLQSSRVPVHLPVRVSRSNKTVNFFKAGTVLGLLNNGHSKCLLSVPLCLADGKPHNDEHTATRALVPRGICIDLKTWDPVALVMGVVRGGGRGSCGEILVSSPLLLRFKVLSFLVLCVLEATG